MLRAAQQKAVGLLPRYTCFTVAPALKFVRGGTTHRAKPRAHTNVSRPFNPSVSFRSWLASIYLCPTCFSINGIGATYSYAHRSMLTPVVREYFARLRGKRSRGHTRRPFPYV